jgi:hypothetical protein
VSPVRKPSDRGLRTAAVQPARDVLREAAPTPASPQQKPARITLNLPPELYRELIRWTGTAAEAIDVPRVGVQEALRAMVRVVTEGQARNAEPQIFTAIRDELAR